MSPLRPPAPRPNERTFQPMDRIFQSNVTLPDDTVHQEGWVIWVTDQFGRAQHHMVIPMWYKMHTHIRPYLKGPWRTRKIGGESLTPTDSQRGSDLRTYISSPCLIFARPNTWLHLEPRNWPCPPLLGLRCPGCHQSHMTESHTHETL